MFTAAKAFVAGAIAGLSAAAANQGSGTKVDIIIDVMSALVAFNATYFVPNKNVTKTTS